jgi:hypothetical protein
MSVQEITSKNLFDLRENSLENLVIEGGDYNCEILDEDGNDYGGFILAESPAGKAITVCEVDFHISDNDKYQPRLTFKRVDEDFKPKDAPSGSRARIIPFHKGLDGYEEFWEMISFLKGFDDLVDTGSYDSKYKVVSEEAVINFLNNKDQYEEVLNNLGENQTSSIHAVTTVNLLKKYREKIKEFIDGNATEMEVQNWLDEDDDNHRQDRCMIFGLEYIKHKREGGSSGKSYDVLTRIGNKKSERVLIELKGPEHDVFKTNTRDGKNDPSKKYHLSPKLAEAIPQVLEYKRDLNTKPEGDSELSRIGEDGPIDIAKSIIVIGESKSSTRWRKNFLDLKKSLSSNLEIWTYTDLVDKLDSTIDNLERARTENDDTNGSNDVPF